MKMSTWASSVCRALSRALATGLFCTGVLSHVPAHAAAVPGEILVKLRSSDAITALLTRYDLTLKGRFGARPIFRLGAGPMADVRATVEVLRLDPAVLIAEEKAVNGSPETRSNLVWAIGTPEQYQQQWAQAALHLADAQRISTGKGIRVAVLDTGVDAQHPLLAGKLLPGYDFVDGDLDPSEVGTRFDAGFGHGTHVAGIVLTAAPDARIMPLRVLDAQGMGNTWVLAEALLFAVDPAGNPATDDGADVINLSLGGPGRTRILQSVARIANCNFTPIDADDDDNDPGCNGDKDRCTTSRGVTIVAAAGNDGSTVVKEYPAAEGVDGLVAVT